MVTPQECWTPGLGLIAADKQQCVFFVSPFEKRDAFQDLGPLQVCPRTRPCWTNACLSPERNSGALLADYLVGQMLGCVWKCQEKDGLLFCTNERLNVGSWQRVWSRCLWSNTNGATISSPFFGRGRKKVPAVRSSVPSSGWRKTNGGGANEAKELPGGPMVGVHTPF